MVSNTMDYLVAAENYVFASNEDEVENFCAYYSLMRATKSIKYSVDLALYHVGMLESFKALYNNSNPELDNKWVW